MLESKGDSPKCYWHTGLEKSNDYKLQKERELSMSHSDDSLDRRLGRESKHDKHAHSDIRLVDARHEKNSRPSHDGRDKRPCHAERPNSGKEECSRSSERHGDGRHRHHDVESKKHHERRGHYDSDSSLGRHSALKDIKGRVEFDFKDSHKKHHGNSDSGFEPRDRDIGHDSRHSRHSAKHLRDRHHVDRWQMVNGFGGDHRDEYRSHKRRAH